MKIIYRNTIQYKLHRIRELRINKKLSLDMKLKKLDQFIPGILKKIQRNITIKIIQSNGLIRNSDPELKDYKLLLMNNYITNFYIFNS